MSNKKVLATLLAASMLAGTLGCGQTVFAEESWTNDDSATITILYGGDNTPDQDNIVLQKLEEMTNTQIDMIYLPNGDYDTKRNAMITSGETPDIFRLNDMAYAKELKEAGLLKDLRPVLEAVAPEILEKYGDKLNQVPINDDGIYLFPNMALYYPCGLNLRADWLENLGMEMPTDLESFAEVMHAFTYDDPNQNGVDDTWGLSCCFDMVNNASFTIILGAYGIPSGKPIVLEDGTVTTFAKHEHFVEACQYIKGLFDDGVVEPDFLTVPAMSSWEQWWNGKSGALEFAGHGPLANWMPGRYTEDPLPVFDYCLLEGPYGDMGTPAMYPNLTSGFAVSADSDNVEGVARIIKYCNSQEGNELLFMGVEGVMYNWIDKEQGTYERIGEYADDTLQRQHGGWVYSEMFQPEIIAEVTTMEKQAQEAIAYGHEHPIEWPYILAVNEVEAEYGADMNQVLLEMWAEVVQTDVEDIPEVVADYIAEWEAAGGSEWEVEATRLWNEQNQ